MKIEYVIPNNELAAKMLWNTITCALRDMFDELNNNEDNVLRLRYYDANDITFDDDETYVPICSCEMDLIRHKKDSDELSGTRLVLVNLMKDKTSDKWSIEIPIKNNTVVVCYEPINDDNPTMQCYMGLIDENGKQINGKECTDSIVRTTYFTVVQMCCTFFKSLPSKKGEE